MKTEKLDYDIETGESLNLNKLELSKNYKLIKREKTFKQHPELTIVWQNGWQKSKNEQYRQGNLFC